MLHEFFSEVLHVGVPVMSQISAAAVKDLRLRTGLGVMACRDALAETDGDVEQAVDWLRRNSGLKAAKKSDRTTAEGVVLAQLSDDKRVGVLAEINCETDFVARDENFLEFCSGVLHTALRDRESDQERLMQGEMEKSRQLLVHKLGENIHVRRVALLAAPEEADLYFYVHGNSRLAALLSMSGGGGELGRDIAMHIVASAPQVIRPEDLSTEWVERERTLYLEQAISEGKPPEIAEKIAVGRVRKLLAENSLLGQPFVREPEHDVAAILKQRGGEILSFVRYALGGDIASS